MNQLPRKLWILPAVAGVIVLAGCGNSAEPLSAADTGPRAKPELSIESIDSPSEPTVPLAVSYVFDAEPTVGEPLTIGIAVTGERAGDVTLRMATRGGLALSANMPSSVALNVGSGATDAGRFDLVVTPEEAGQSFVNLQFLGSNEGRPFIVAKTVPVQAVAAELAVDTNGRPIDTGVEVLSAMPGGQEVGD
ncbi:MAG: hypothetical protein AAGL69_07535 [Pseudomonadota bacterium]